MISIWNDNAFEYARECQLNDYLNEDEADDREDDDGPDPDYRYDQMRDREAEEAFRAERKADTL